MLSFWNKIKEKAIAILDEQIPNLEGQLEENQAGISNVKSQFGQENIKAKEPSQETENISSTSSSQTLLLGDKRRSAFADSNGADQKRFCLENDSNEHDCLNKPSPQQTTNISMEGSTIGWGLEDSDNSHDLSKTQNQKKPKGNIQLTPPKQVISREEAIICKKCKKPADSLFARDFAFHLSKHSTQLFRLQCGSCPFKHTSDKKVATHWVDQHKKAPASRPKDLMSDEMRKNYEKVGRECFPDSLDLILDWCDQPFAWEDDKLLEYRIKGVTRCEVCTLETQLSLQGLLKHAATHIDYKLYFCGYCKQGMTSAQAGCRHIAYKHEDVPLEQEIIIETNRSKEFFRDLLLASSQCFPTMKKQFEDNLEIVFTNGKELIEKPMIDRKKRKAALEIMKSTAKKSQGPIQTVPILNKPKRGSTKRVIMTKSARGTPQPSPDRDETRREQERNNNDFSMDAIQSAPIYNPYNVYDQSNSNEIYMPNFLTNQTGESNDTAQHQLVADSSCDPNYQYLFL